MDKQLLFAYIQEYKSQFHAIHLEEIDKWQMVKQFQDHWDINAADFYPMLETSFSLSGNLLDSGKYFPKRMLLKNAEKSTEKVRDLFRFLFNEEIDLLERINYFREEFLKISKDNFPESNKTYQDDRAILFYLNLRFPERYYLYKFKMFKIFTTKLSYDYNPKKGSIDNIGQYFTLCNLINNEINNDQELLKLHNARISDDCYFDKNLHILTQDLIFAVSSHLTIESNLEKEKNITQFFSREFNSNEVQLQSQDFDLTPRLVNHQENNSENKTLGDLGEQWVLRFERNRLKEAGKSKLAEKIRHISIEKGDGAGFDIASFNEDGTQRFIEVKTTKSICSQTIFITRNELEKSKIEKENFHLYRVYNYNEEEKSAKLMIIKGELSSLCNFPTLYKANIKDTSD